MLSTFYQKIQLIMTMLGLYDGQCDGVWGPKCIEAKRKWELMDEFEPAVPSNGLPFNGRGRLPKGMSYAYKGLDIIWTGWDEVRAQAILAEKGNLLTPELIEQHILGVTREVKEEVPEPVAVVDTVSQEPLASSVLDVNMIDAKAEHDDVEKPSEPADAAPQQMQGRNWTKNRK